MKLKALNKKYQIALLVIAIMLIVSGVSYAYFAIVAKGTSNPQAISITFESNSTPKSTGSTNGTYLTHPAFTFGTTELNGIWIGKFENGGSTTGIQIKPNIKSFYGLTLGDMFNAARNIENNYASNYGINASTVDTHMIKNIDWGAVSYLSSSIYGRYDKTSTCISSGCQVWINNVNTAASGSYGSSITGCSGSSVGASTANSMTACASGYDWSTLGVNASTTGNTYGIYDMDGGDYEYVMGNMVNSSGNYNISSSTLIQPNSKYYDSYAYSTASFDTFRGKLGDATKEILKALNSYSGGWYNGSCYFPTDATGVWFNRGCGYDTGSSGGLFNLGNITGGEKNFASTRVVITAE